VTALLIERAMSPWVFQEALAACFEREVASHQTHGGESRIRRRASRDESARGLRLLLSALTGKELVHTLGALDSVESKDNGRGHRWTRLLRNVGVWDEWERVST
jgi:hypothetical protein